MTRPQVIPPSRNNLHRTKQNTLFVFSTLSKHSSFGTVSTNQTKTII
jgi:hypothetical protein